MAYSLYKTFSDLVITKEDILEAELFTRQVLEAKYPTLDLREGSGLDDIVIRPSATMVAMVTKGVEKHLLDNRVNGITNDSDTETVDAILSNFFVDRKVGSKAQVVVRAKYSTRLPSDSVTISPSSYFSIDNINKFKPITTSYLTKGDNLNLYTSISGDYYYADITCESETEGTQYNIAGGSEFLFFSVSDPYFIGATALYVVSESIVTESNTDFVKRAPDAISTRNLINNISIPARLNEKFNYIKRMVVAGLGDYGQERDYREIVIPGSGNVIPVHIGGYVDVYVDTSFSEVVVQVTTDAFGKVDITGTDPILRITIPSETESSTATIYGGAKATTNLLSQVDVEGYVYDDLNYDGSGLFHELESGFSGTQRIRINRPGIPLPGNSSFDVKLLVCNKVRSIQEFLNEAASRVVCANYVARGFNVVDVNVKFYVQGDAPTGDLLASTLVLVKDKCAEYAQAITPAGEFVTSEVFASVTPLLAPYTVSTRVDLEYSLYDSRCRSYPPVGVPNPDGVIRNIEVYSTPGHDESSSTKVATSYIYRINSVEILGT